MLRTMRPFLIVLVCSWMALVASALFYSSQHPHSYWIMRAALPAFAVEVFLYLASISEETRVWFSRINSPVRQATILWLSALLPYLVFASQTGTLNRNALFLLTLLFGVLAYWYALLPRRPAFDIGFLVIAAAPVLLRVFPRIYRSPDEHLRIDVLGHLAWIRLGIAALLVLREWHPGAFGLWPRAAEWRSGSLWFLVAVLPLSALAMAIGLVQFAPFQEPWWRVVGTFFGVLWVVALSEELFFRGVIERALLSGWQSPATAIAVSSVLYGGSHFWYRAFPNWRDAVVTTALGVICGAAYARTGSVRTPMVTHAFVVSTMRLFFRYT